MSEPTLDNELAATESLLAALRPAAAGLNPDRLMFQAGEAAGRAGKENRRALSGAGRPSRSDRSSGRWPRGGPR